MNTDAQSEQRALQTIERTVVQSKAVELAEVTEYDGQGALCPVQDTGQIVPIRPATLEAEQETAINTQAQALVEMIRSDPNNWRIQGLIFNLGQEAVEKANVHVGLYEEKMGVVLRDVTADSSPVTGDILAVKEQLDLVNPSVLANQKITEKVGRIFKKTIHRLPKGDEILRTISERRETVKSTVNGLKRRMNEHSDVVIRHSAELGVICDNLKEIQPELHAEIYKGQVAWKALQDHYTGMGEGIAKESVSNLLADLATAVVDLQQVDNMNLQTRYGGGLIIRNSYNVQRIIRSTSTLIGAVANALALRVVAAQQLQTMEAAQAIQRAIGRTMEDTAEQVGKAMVKSAEMSQEMVRNVESLQRSCDHFDLAAQALAAVCDETIKIAGQASNALGSMNERLQIRASAVEAMRRE